MTCHNGVRVLLICCLACSLLPYMITMISGEHMFHRGQQQHYKWCGRGSCYGVKLNWDVVEQSHSKGGNCSETFWTRWGSSRQSQSVIAQQHPHSETKSTLVLCAFTVCHMKVLNKYFFDFSVFNPNPQICVHVKNNMRQPLITCGSL